MKTLAAIFILAVVAKLTECSKELNDFAMLSRKCFEDNGVKENEFNDLFSYGPKPETANQKIKCSLKCIMEKLNHLKNGVLDVNAAMKTWSSIPEFAKALNDIKKGIEACKSEKGDDDCDTAYKISMCLNDKIDV